MKKILVFLTFCTLWYVAHAQELRGRYQVDLRHMISIQTGIDEWYLALGAVPSTAIITAIINGNTLEGSNLEGHPDIGLDGLAGIHLDYKFEAIKLDDGSGSTVKFSIKGDTSAWGFGTDIALRVLPILNSNDIKAKFHDTSVEERWVASWQAFNAYRLGVGYGGYIPYASGGNAQSLSDYVDWLLSQSWYIKPPPSGNVWFPDLRY